MICNRWVAVCLLLALAGVRSASAVDYFWQSAGGGAYATAANWLPAVPAGPGGTADTVNFDLGVALANRYTVTGVGGQSNRLRVHHDTVRLNVTDYTLTGAGAAAPGLVAGVASGDAGNLLLSGAAGNVIRTDVSSVGLVAGSSGVVLVDGLQWNGTGSMRVGDGGTGSLFISNGADVTQGSITVGNLAGSGGTVNVSGNGSTWNTAGELIVGRQDGGFVSVENGGDATSGSATVGAFAGVTGTMVVSSTNSSWTNSGPLTIGSAGDGTLLVQAGADVTSTNGFVARLMGSEGTVSVSSAGSTWSVSGRLSVGGDSTTNIAGGEGTVDVLGSGAVTVGSDITIFPTGQVRVAGGILSAGEIRFQGAGGQFGWTSGTVQLGAYRGSLVNAAGTLEARGLIGVVTIDNNYTQQGAGKLRLGVGGPTPNTSYDVVNVGGTASLDGLLEIEQLAGFVPQPGQTFTVLNSAALSGAFDNVANGQRLAVTGGTTSGTFVVNYGAGSAFDPKRIVLSSFQITGDYNLDGMVSAADYTVWRDTLGSTTDLRANGDNTGASAGVIDVADFNAWKVNFGRKATGLGAGSLGFEGAVVPEPASVVLVGMAAVFGFRRRRSIRYQ